MDFSQRSPISFGPQIESEGSALQAYFMQHHLQNQIGNSEMSQRLSFAGLGIENTGMNTGNDAWSFTQSSDAFSLGQSNQRDEIQYHAELFQGHTLKEGDVGIEVRALQDMLRLLGLMSTFEPSGTRSNHTFGPRTKAAVENFQASHEIPQSGEADPATHRALREALSAAPNPLDILSGDPPLQRRSRNRAAVRVMQERLVYFGATMTVDGSFGPGTETIIKQFQELNGLPATGIVDQATAQMLKNDNAIPIAQRDNRINSAEPQVEVLPGDPQGRLNHSNVHPIIKQMTETMIAILQNQGLQPFVVSTFRSFSEQNALFQQGRNGDNRGTVTNAQGGESWHNYGLAVDIVFYRPGTNQPSWDAPAADWDALGRAGLAAGFTRWLGQSQDRPHFEYHPTWTRSPGVLASTFRQEGLQAVWEKAVDGKE